ncbi:MAG: GNAT family protein [Alphaproteobacteria bacterium]
MLDLGIVEFKKFHLSEKIVGDKITLLRRRSEHNEELFNLINNSRDTLGRFLFWVEDTKNVEDVAQVTEIFSKNWDEQNSFEYVFIENETNKIVGAGGIHTVSYMNRWAEYGYYFDDSATGKGYATQAVALLEEELFSKGIHRLVIECDVENIASAKVAEKNGFELEAILKDAKFAFGKYHSQKYYVKFNSKEN